MSAPRNIQIVWTRAARIRHALNQDLMVDKWDGEKELGNSWKWSCSFWVQIDFFLFSIFSCTSKCFKISQNVSFKKQVVLSKENEKNYKKWLDVDFEDIFPISTLKPPIFLAWNSTKFRFFWRNISLAFMQNETFWEIFKPFLFYWNRLFVRFVYIILHE